MLNPGDQGFFQRGPHVSNVTTISALFRCGGNRRRRHPGVRTDGERAAILGLRPASAGRPATDRRTPAGLRSATAAARYARASRPSRQQSATGPAGAARKQQSQRRRPRRYGLLGRQRRSDHVVAGIINPSRATIVAVLLRLRVDAEATLTSGIRPICPGRVRGSRRGHPIGVSARSKRLGRFIKPR